MRTIFDPFPGEFRLLHELGHGAFGNVWLAEDLSPLGRQVALKFVRLDSAHGANALDALRHEAKLLASMSHPHIVQVHAWRQSSGSDVPCLVLQFVAGGSLETMVQRTGPLAWDVATRYVADIADGLSALHARGIMHRDVKPANMLHNPHTDEALVTDLGIAARLTDPATTAGTALFMAPEAFRGVLSPVLDVYSLAASLFWLVSAQHPFDGESRDALRRAIERGLPRIDRRLVGLPRSLEEMLRAGLQASPADRPSLHDFALRLRGSLNRLLADRLAGSSSTPAHLRLLVWRLTADGVASPIMASPREPEPMPRDAGRVPSIPDRFTLYTGDRVRVEVLADLPGYVTVFNVGPSGRLNLLYPMTSREQVEPIQAGRPVPLLEVELTPPTGRERLVALWTREPSTLNLDELRSLTESGNREYQATRDMAVVRESLAAVAAGQRQTVVVELDHQARC